MWPKAYGKPARSTDHPPITGTVTAESAAADGERIGREGDGIGGIPSTEAEGGQGKEASEDTDPHRLRGEALVADPSSVEQVDEEPGERGGRRQGSDDQHR